MKVTQSCLTLGPHGLYSPWNSPGQNTGVGSLAVLQEIFPIQGLNPGLPHCRATCSSPAEPQGKPKFTREDSHPFSSGSSPPRNQTESAALQTDSLPTELSGKPIGRGGGYGFPINPPFPHIHGFPATMNIPHQMVNVLQLTNLY